MICLPQAYQLFLSDVIGGMHTVYTKLKRLGIQPIICNVEQVRLLRGVGAIQSGVNRCKLIKPGEFDKLYEDCTDLNSRPGRPAKRVSPISKDECKPQKRQHVDTYNSFGLWPGGGSSNVEATFTGDRRFIHPSLYGSNIHHPTLLAPMVNPNRVHTESFSHSLLPSNLVYGGEYQRTRNFTVPREYQPRRSNRYRESFMIDNLIDKSPKQEQPMEINNKLQTIINEISSLNQSLSSIDTHLKGAVHDDLQIIKNEYSQSKLVTRRLQKQLSIYTRNGRYQYGFSPRLFRM
ncbi:hypothetical protein ACOME3_006671 [Neoechinorhynchus agilis]